MKTRKIPLRTCVVTGEKLDKRDLLRVVKNKEGKQILLPAIQDVIKQIDMDNDRIVVHLIEGLV